MHLDDSRLAALLANPKGEQELVAHLAAGCDTCEGFLEQHADRLDGLTDQVLGSLRAARPATLDEVGWQRLRRSLRAARGAGWRLAVPLAAAAALAAAVVGGVLLTRPPADDLGLKGETARIQLELSAAVRTAAGDIVRVEPGAHVKAGGVLVLRYHVTEAAQATLWVQRGTAEPQRLGAVELEPGTHDLLSSRGELMGLSLDAEQGEVAMWVVAGRAPTSLTPLEARPQVDSGALKDVAVGRVMVIVEP